MPVSTAYRDFVLDQLSRIRLVTHRAMFGGVGIYSEGLIFALIDDDRLYFKVDDGNRSKFEAVGMGPFAPFGEASKPMGYYELPGDLLEDDEQLRPWIDDAVEVARRAQRKKRK